MSDCPAGQTARVTSNLHSSSSSTMAVSRVPSPPLPEVNTPVAENWCYTQVSNLYYNSSGRLNFTIQWSNNTQKHDENSRIICTPEKIVVFDRFISIRQSCFVVFFCPFFFSKYGTIASNFDPELICCLCEINGSLVLCPADSPAGRRN